MQTFTDLNRASKTDSLVDYVVWLPIFIVACTPIEIATEQGASVYASVIRAVAAMVFVSQFVLRSSSPIKKEQLTSAFAITTYFVATNVLAYTYTASLSTITIFAGLLLGASAVGNLQRLNFFLKSYMQFHWFGLTLAFGIWMYSGEIYDLHAMIFPFSAARAHEFLGYVRLTGFQIEPGTYTHAMYAFILMRSLLRRKIFNWFDFLIIVSTLLTFAAWSIIGASFYFAAAGLEFLLKKDISSTRKLLTVVTLGPLVILLMTWLSNGDYSSYLSARFRTDAGSAKYKVDAWNALIDSFQNPQTLFGNALSNPYCPQCIAPQDLGALINMAYYMGIIFSLTLVVLCFRSLKNSWGYTFVLLFLPMFLLKFFFYDFLVWMPLGIILLMSRGDKEHLVSKNSTVTSN
jgi:hypothetical protein